MFTSGLESGYLGAGVVVVINSFLARHIYKILEVPGQLLSIKLLFKNKLSVSILGLYTGASSVVQFSQAGNINFLIAKAVNKSFFVILGGDFNKDNAQKCASFKKCFDLGLVDFLKRSLFAKMPIWTNFHGVAKVLNYILISSSLVNAIIDGSVAGVKDYFDTDHKAVSTSMGLRGLLNIHKFKDATAVNTAMFLDEFGSARRFSNLDAMWDIVCKIIIFLANRAFKKKWFKSYNGVFTKESSKLYNLEILVLKIVKASHKMNSSQFESLLKHWDLISFDASLDHVYSALYGVRRSYHESGIKSAIEKKMENFVVNKDHTICSVLECLFHKVVLNHLVFNDNVILDSIEVKNKIDGIIEDWIRKRAVLRSVSDLWQYQYLSLDYVNDNAFSGVMNAISLNDLMHVIKNLLNGKAAGLFGISNELWKHCDESMLSWLLDFLNICLVCESVPHSCGLFDVLYRDNFFVLKSTTTQSSIFAIGLVVEDALEKNHELWLVLQNMLKVYDVKRQKSLCEYQIDTKFVVKTGRVENQDSLTSFLAAGAFVDDTIWYILDIASEFFMVNNISINNKKTVVIPINQKVGNVLLSINNLLISVACKKKSHWYFGIYLSSEGLSKSSLAKTYVDIRFFVNLVLKKAILDKQFLYLISAVLQSITEYKVASVLCFSNAGGVFGYLFNHRSLDLQVLGWLPIHSLCCLVKLCVSSVNNFLASIVRIFLDYDMSLDNFSVFVFHLSDGIPMSTVLRASLFYDVSSSLKRFGVVFAEQLYIKKGLRLDPRGPVPHWFTLACDFLVHFSFFDDLHIESLQTMDVCSSSKVSRLGQCLFSADVKVISVYTDGSLRDLSLCKIKCGVAAYFPNLNLDISTKVSGLVSSTIVELQAIALALECVLPNSLVVVYSDSQAALNACQHGIFNLIKKKQLDVSWHKVKEHLGVIGNERADKLASLAASSTLVLPVLVKERFIKTGKVVMSENICHFAYEIFRSVNCAYWEVGLGLNIIDNSLCVTGFTSKFTASLCSYFLKALYYYLLHCVSGLGLLLSYISQIQKAMSFPSDAKTVGKFIVDFVWKLAKYKALIEKNSLISLDGSVYLVTCGLLCMFSAGVIRLLEIAKALGICFGFCKHCCFFSGIDSMVSVLIDS
ncbi:hypothetical protein G9A89_008797 [Geosiphon pyriformis]|nr:hypothetical protein G9A89_008797 [Geosiphon pyriformis]